MTSACSMDLLESALAGNLPGDVEGRLHLHLEECDACAAAMERMAGGDAWCQEAAMLLTADELDSTVPTQDHWSEVDFTVEHLEPADEPGVIGRLAGYDVLEILGHGGMGIVLKGFDRELKRCVAIKVLAPHLAQSSLARKRFAREAQAAAAVVHPHVLAIHQVQASGRLPFLVMPLVAGESLAERLAAQGTLELKEILRIGMQAAAGLAAAHEQGLVHRDVKPANILLETGIERAVLTDFGLARAADDIALTRYGIIAGTPEYMSPEQARGEPLDGRSDLFSLGCVLYEMATGVSPFRTDSTIATLRRLVDDAPRAMESLNPELPPWFVAIVNRLLEKEPARRIGSAQEVSELLEGCLAHVQQPSNVPLPAGLPKPAVRRTWRRFVPLVSGVCVMLAVSAIGLLGFALLTAEPPDIAGQWSGEGWGQVVLKKSGETQYSGTYTGTLGDQPGEMELKWSPIERRYHGTWREGGDRFGEISVRLVEGEIRGAWTVDRDAKINPVTPRLADLTWVRSTEATEALESIRYRGVCVRSEDGAPVEGALVRVFLYRRKNQAKLWKTTTTDGDGRFTIEGQLAQGDDFERPRSRLAVSAPKRASKVLGWTEESGEIKVELPAPASVSGRVVDSASRPVAGATVYVQWSHFPVAPLPSVHSAITDAEGRYTIDDLEAADRFGDYGGFGSGYGGLTKELVVKHPEYESQGVTLKAIPSTVNVALRSKSSAWGAFTRRVTFEIGATLLKDGDQITIEEVRGTADTMKAGGMYEIRGTYRLASRSNAVLAAMVTDDGTDARAKQLQDIPMQKTQSLAVKRGEGQFALVMYMWHDGQPHVSFYPEAGEGFAHVYFGTGDSMLKRGWWEARVTPSGATLVDAVRAFNGAHADDPVGKTQPPLTDEEVVSAIRWAVDVAKPETLSEQAQDELRGIAEGQRSLSAPWRLEAVKRVEGAAGERFAAWSIRLVRDNSSGEKEALLVRQRLLWPLDAEGQPVKLLPMTTASGGTTLASAIAAFNARHCELAGQSQPPLTEEEVVAAIRCWKTRRDEAPVTDGEFAQFQRIAETRVLPPGAHLEVIGHFRPADRSDFYIWSVRVVLPRGEAGSGSYAYEIRKQHVRSERSDDSQIAWGPVVDGFRAGVRLDPQNDEYVTGQRIVPTFYFRNEGSRQLETSFPRLMTKSYYDELLVFDAAGQAIRLDQGLDPGGPVGWIAHPLAPGGMATVRGLPIVLGEVERGDAETAIRARPGQSVRLRFVLPNFAEPDGKPLSTGEVAFSIATSGQASAPPREKGDAGASSGVASNGDSLDPLSLEYATQRLNAGTAEERRQLFDPPIPDLTVEQLREGFRQSAKLYRQKGKQQVAETLERTAETGRLPEEASGGLIGSGAVGKDESGKIVSRQIVPALVLPDDTSLVGRSLVVLRPLELIYRKGGPSSKNYGDLFDVESDSPAAEENAQPWPVKPKRSTAEAAADVPVP